MLINYFNNFYNAYINNIFIFSNNLEEYKIYVKKILIRFEAAGF